MLGPGKPASPDHAVSLPAESRAGLPNKIIERTQYQPYPTQIKTVPVFKANPNSDPDPGPIHAAAALPNRLPPQNENFTNEPNISPNLHKSNRFPLPERTRIRPRILDPSVPRPRCLARAPAEMENCMNEPN